MCDVYVRPILTRDVPELIVSIQVILVPQATRCPVFDPVPRFWEMAWAYGRASFHCAECLFLHSGYYAMGVSLSANSSWHACSHSTSARNLFATRGRRLSIFQHTPASNWYVFPAAGMALVLAIFFSYVPWL